MNNSMTIEAIQHNRGNQDEVIGANPLISEPLKLDSIDENDLECGCSGDCGCDGDDVRY